MNSKSSPGLSVAIVSVCFDSSAIVGRMLESVPAGVPVILVDNGSADVALTKAIADQYGARLLTNPENLGFGVACNQGAIAAGVEANFLFFLNPDAMLTERTIEMLLLAAQRYPSASAFNPAIFDESGRPSHKRSSVLLPRSRRERSGGTKGDRIVAVLSGAALFVRRQAFDEVGGFDQEIFPYHEDDDLSLRLGQECGPLMFAAESRVIHTGGHSSSRTIEMASLKGWHMGRSRVYASRKHGRPLAFARALALALRQVASPISWLSDRSRAKHWYFLRGVLSNPKSHIAPASVDITPDETSYSLRSGK